MARSSIIPIRTISDVEDYLSPDLTNSLFIFDVDNTILGVESAILHAGNIEKLNVYFSKLRSLHSIEEYQSLLSMILLQRKPKLVETKILRILEQLKVNGIKSIALTKFDTTAFGSIPNRAEWRANELTSLGVNFSYSFPDLPKLMHFTASGLDNGNTAVYNSGVLMTGAMSKDAALGAFLDRASYRPKKLIMIDDSSCYLTAISEFCAARRIEFVGLHYSSDYLTNTPIVRDNEVALQFNFLIQNKLWLSADDIQKRFQDSGKSVVKASSTGVKSDYQKPLQENKLFSNSCALSGLGAGCVLSLICYNSLSRVDKPTGRLLSLIAIGVLCFSTAFGYLIAYLMNPGQNEIELGEKKHSKFAR